jgi:hypothetical protein
MEEFDTTSGESIEVLQKFTNWVETFCKENNIIEYKDRNEYEPIINMSNGEILSLSSDECFANALTLMNYAGILQKKYDLIDSQYNWCIEALNFLYAKYWDNYDKFLPAEIRKKSIISDNSFAQSIEKCRLRLYASMQILSETTKDIKRRVTLFQDFGKSRSFK